jgi:hypothetical protein
VHIKNGLSVGSTDGTFGNTGEVLTSQGVGVAPIWAPVSGWSTSGNSGTIDGTDFIGTTDNVALNFRVNNEKAGRMTLDGQVFYGYQAGNSNTAKRNTGVGFTSLFANTSGNDNASFGYEAMYSNTTGFENMAGGRSALYSNQTGIQNTALGANSLYTNANGNRNTALGAEAMYSNVDGAFNSAIGYQSLWKNTSGGYNVANGYSALYNNTTGGSNTAIGNYALFTNTTGNNNVAIGYQANVATGNLSKAVAIGYNAIVSSSNALVLGGTGVDAVSVGIGVSAPNATLDIAGDIKITDGTEGIGKVLTSDATGLASWAAPTGLSLPFSGSSGTSANTLDVTNTSTGVAIKATNSGTGMAADFTSSNGSQTLYVLNTGSGRAGQFTGSGSGNATLQAQNDGAGGSALALFQSNAGYALDIQQGGLKLSNQSVVAPATISTKAALYQVTGSGNVNLPSGTVGETCWVANSSGVDITVNAGPTVLNGTIRQFIFLSGGWQIVN